MLIKKVFSIYDSKAEVFAIPVFFRNAGEAIRAFQTAVGDAESPYCQHPEDYSLHEIGSFDEDSGALVALERGPLHLTGALQLKGEER